MPMKSYDDGTIVHIDHAAGEEVALGQRVMVLAKKSEDPKKVAASLGLGGAGEGRRPPADAAAVERATPADRRGGRPASHRRTGQRQRPAGRRRRTQAAEQRRGAAGSRPARWPGSWPRRRSVDLAQVRGSGPGGRIIRRDIEAFLQPRPPPATAAPAARGTVRGGRAAAGGRPRPTGRGPAGRAAHPALADAQDDRPADAPGQADGPRDPPDRRHPRRPPGRRPRGAEQAAGPRGDQALAGRLRHQGRRDGAAGPPGRQRQLRARRDRPPRRGQHRHRRRAARGPDRPGPPPRRYPGPARDPQAERGPRRRRPVQ